MLIVKVIINVIFNLDVSTPSNYVLIVSINNSDASALAFLSILTIDLLGLQTCLFPYSFDASLAL